MLNFPTKIDDPELEADIARYAADNDIADVTAFLQELAMRPINELRGTLKRAMLAEIDQFYDADDVAALLPAVDAIAAVKRPPKVEQP